MIMSKANVGITINMFVNIIKRSSNNPPLYPAIKPIKSPIIVASPPPNNPIKMST